MSSSSVASRKVLGISRSFFDCVIGIAGEGRLELHLLLDAVEAGGEERRESQIGIEIGTADAAFDADRLGIGAAQAIARGAVVEAPDRRASARKFPP